MTDAYEIGSAEGTITVTAAVLVRIVQGAAEAVDGVRVLRPRRRVEVRLDDGRARVELELAARYGTVLPAVVHDVQERVADALRTMCGLDVESVDVAVEELE
jgi:uncharacterized alkaline shock family protein YloU